jgi:hypothetical protein
MCIYLFLLALDFLDGVVEIFFLVSSIKPGEKEKEENYQPHLIRQENNELKRNQSRLHVKHFSQIQVKTFFFFLLLASEQAGGEATGEGRSRSKCRGRRCHQNNSQG